MCPVTILFVDCFQVTVWLVFSVSWGNVFILVQTCQYQPRREDETHYQHIGRTLGTVAPSMLCSAFAEAACTFLSRFSFVSFIQLPVIVECQRSYWPMSYEY